MARSCDRGWTILPLHAWGDESVRSLGPGTPSYLLGASVVDTEDIEACREVLARLRPTRGKLHWHDLNDRQRQRVIPAVARRGVSLLTLEARAAALTRRDLRVIEALRGRRVLPPSLRIEHGDPDTEPMLWLPDQVLGAFGRADKLGQALPPGLAGAVETHEVQP